MKTPLVSIIIPTYNSAHSLEACLTSVNGQTYPSHEVVIVDQSSSDDTLKIAKTHGATIITRPLPEFYSPPSRSRNIGVAAAKGAILCHFDSDMELAPDLVAEAVDRFAGEARLGALIVHEADIANGYWSACKALERRCYWGNDSIESARIVRRELFEQIGGYDETIGSGEDFDIHRRYKAVTRVGYCQSVLRHNLGEISYRRAIWKKFQYGKTAQAYLAKHGSPGSIIGIQIGCYLRNHQLLRRRPMIGLGMIWLKFSEQLAGALGLLSAATQPRPAAPQPAGRSSLVANATKKTDKQ